MSNDYMFPLVKTGGQAMIQILKPEHLSNVLALQDATRAALLPAQKMFILPQTPDYFERFLMQEKGHMVGVWEAGQLIAHMVLMGELALSEAEDQHAITRNDVLFHHAAPTDRVVMAKSVAVHPDWRGNEVAQHLLSYALATPLARRADHVFAQISAENVRSWDMFLRQGFAIVAAALDPSDKKPRFILQKPALDFALHDQAGTENIHPLTDFAAIMRLTHTEALIGRPDHGAAYALAFYASAETAASWYEEASSTLSTRNT